MCINIGDAMFWEPFIPQLMANKDYPKLSDCNEACMQYAGHLVIQMSNAQSGNFIKFLKKSSIAGYWKFG
ncbi:hypothetical protein T4D_13594 [Trichinella pseudospiralis]|uniref:Uncharacterized protein n=1 Tax=Trichinella pseudospiralis TaxID=6337 RepID=A0A0V1FEC1_TRIPS|nr:hypothetical protein T4D_13594 [Trichinella pseudospiralis]